MIKKSVFVKTFAGVIATSLVVGAITYKTVRMEEPQSIDFSAFKNAAANISYLSQKPATRAPEAQPDLNGTVVRVIEKEVRAKILKSRYAMTPKKPKIEAVKVIAKNWNDIKPEFASVDMNVDSKLISAISSNEVASEFEINNKELIKLYGYEVDSLQYETFSNTTLAELTEPAQAPLVDEVKVAQASTTSHVVEDIIPDSEKINPVNDDLVMFDYSDSADEVAVAPKHKKIFDSPISDSVKNAIERAVHKSPRTAMNTQPSKKMVAAPVLNSVSGNEGFDLEKVMADEDTVVYDYANRTTAATAKSAAEETKSAISAFAAGPTIDNSQQAEFTIAASEVNLATQKINKAYGFEFTPDYDRSERSDDQTSGEIKLGYSLAGDVGTISGVISAHGMIPTRVELNLLNRGMNIPMLNEEGIQRFLKKKQADVVGNLLMVAVDPSVNDVEIDSEYSYKLFFSSKFKMLESIDKASYVLFLGVKTGNILMRYLLDNKESAQKIVYVGDGEMYYEDPDFKASERELYTFTTRSLLGKKVKELNVDGADISFFGTKTVSKKKALNAYEIKVPELVDNSRKYLEFKHMGTSLFVGTQNTKEIEIPGKDFISRVLQANELSELGNRCMVQINLAKDIRDFKVSGKNMSGEMFAEMSFLDNDGNFSRDNSELAEKVFITGDLEGIFSVRLDYTDGSTDFLKTFCSEGSYLIEQL